jgi:hypothetical protein
MSKVECQVWDEIHRIEQTTGERLSWCGNDTETVDGYTSHKRYAEASDKRGLLTQLKAVA